MSPATLARCRGGLWVHAVSAGETITASALLRALAQRYPELPILLTTTTHTGRERAQALLSSDRFAIAYAPYDSPAAVGRFVSALQPRFVLLMETELWPNMLEALHRANVPVVLANARLSARSARRYGWIQPLTRRMLGQLTFVAAQFDAHAKRFRALGAGDDRLDVLGSLKFDAASTPDVAATLPATWRDALADRAVWIAGSTHAGEESRLLAVHARLRKRLPNALLLLVPRHPDRAASLAALSGEARVAFTSRVSDDELHRVDVLIGDRMGELAALYQLAAVAFVGGSWIPHGGHTPIEPAQAGAAIVFGPHVHNFADVYAAFTAAGAARCVASEDALLAALFEWLPNGDARGAVTAAAAAVVAAHRGASERTLALLGRWL